jgi:hypothetical protein
MDDCKKVKFSDEKSADFYIDKLQRTSHRAVKPVRSYLCPFCFHWHLTSKDSRDENLIGTLKTRVRHLEAENKVLKMQNAEFVKELRDAIISNMTKNERKKYGGKNPGGHKGQAGMQNGQEKARRKFPFQRNGGSKGQSQ